MDIIVDLDDTVADCGWRLHYIKVKPKHWKAFFEGIPHDPPVEPVVDAVKAFLLAGHRIIFCTGRPETYRETSLAWIQKHVSVGVESHHLYMRSKSDFDPDYVTKKRLFEHMKADGYNPLLVIDDKKEVCEMFEGLGLVVLKITRKK